MDRSMSTLVPAIELTLERERERDRDREKIEGKKKRRTAVQLAVDGYRQQIDDMRAAKGCYPKKREAIREREQRMRERQVEIDALDKDIQLLQARITARPQSPSQSPRQSASQSPTQPPAQPSPDKTPSPPTRAPQGRRQSRSAAAAPAGEEAMDEAARADQQQATDDALLFLLLAGEPLPKDDEARLWPRYEAMMKERQEAAAGAGADLAPPPFQGIGWEGFTCCRYAVGDVTCLLAEFGRRFDLKPRQWFFLDTGPKMNRTESTAASGTRPHKRRLHCSPRSTEEET
ncbi:unnamed protein product [Vitrella brassicaformis CCMP3155]|uniref:Uncharacterized protein n=1 Tax=Vitrella brassicaformis (strain CCMP3155) TaxID=1169540 RepID=A0A0G4EY61_VITBC|nr:unnamed protein product [Vitrella brassicaformis CCMP3155]|eukprot:CEM03370.1 unnamed protein product [Vitrella brassicaformis CCMP3155]